MVKGFILSDVLIESQEYSGRETGCLASIRLTDYFKNCNKYDDLVQNITA